MADSSRPQPVVEILPKVDSAASAIDNGNSALRVISGLEAYRRYDWIRGIPAVNSAGNFRGMVVSARWKAVFQFSSEAKDTLGNIAVLAGFAANVAKSSNRIDAIWNSQDLPEIKGARLSTQVSSIAIRTLGGVVPDTTHLVALALEGYCGMADLAFGNSSRLPRACVANLRQVDSWVTTTFDKVTDGEQLYLWINTHLVPR